MTRLADLIDHPADAVGRVRAGETGADGLEDGGVGPRSPARSAPSPGVVTAARNAERVTLDLDRPDRPMASHKAELHFDSCAKKAAAFFKMSRSIFSRVTLVPFEDSSDLD